ncbi:MAG: hypothetical protein WBR15_10880 [Gammaproteobacteria bacterium]
MTVVVGRTRSGKTLSTRLEVKDAPRVLVWDIEGVWQGFRSFTSLKSLLSAIRRDPRGPARWAYSSGERDDFPMWAKLAYWWGRGGGGGIVIAEEIAFTTSPGKAPPGWHQLLAQGLKWNISIYALTQRPAESDKTCLGNATRIRCFALTRAQDRDYMARQLDCAPERLARLKPLEYLERDMLTGVLTQKRAHP